MTYDELLAIDAAHAQTLPAALSALVLDRAGNWDAAHERAASEDTRATNRVHAYLHRKEGDSSNARYWYGRVGESMPDATLADEWADLARRLLTDDGA